MYIAILNVRYVKYGMVGEIQLDADRPLISYSMYTAILKLDQDIVELRYRRGNDITKNNKDTIQDR